ncbi:uncharacterized protein LOC142523563 [Primulina tabacum]|uniref:uncharacterized protein LOC142523563 n=1 Tax=Primulina tabacum TaxID=48773 RepID=UPI003F5992E8
MKKGGGNSERSEGRSRKFGGHESIKNQKMKKNMQRLGGNGGGLSLESFANAKTRSGSYNPSLIKKQREFYKNAKHLRKFKKSLKQLEQENVPSTTIRPFEGGKEAEEGDNVNRQKKKNTRCAQSLQQLYEQKRGEDEKARAERDAVIQVRKQEIQQVEARRRALKEKMYKKTKSGQPVMKYRIEHLLETIQGSTS